ncbi:alpha/beta-hydrolase [Xylariaceae sp. FL0662B]|nr:alpha/beta-hydrolase [Xylariaceae sp. FL0662B]
MSPTIVICSGAWPLAQFFDPLIQAFKALDQVAICKVPESYPAFDPDNPPKRNYDSVFLRDHVLDPLLEDGEDIVIFMHSYGGVYGPEALEGISKKERSSKGLQGGVVAVIFTAAYIAPKGVSAIETMGLSPDKLPDFLYHDRTTDLVWFKKEQAKAMLFHDLPDDEANRLADLLPPQPFTCFSTPVTWDPYGDPNFKGLLGYIHTEADRIVPLELQERYVKSAGINRTYMMKNSSHSPHHEQPDVLAQIVADMMQEIMGKK